MNGVVEAEADARQTGVAKELGQFDWRGFAEYDYDYSSDELAQWSRSRIPEMARQAKTGLIFFNNHVRGQAPKNARMLMEQLAEMRIPD